MTRIRRVLAPNPGPFTLEGTNTWVVGGPPAIVIDPGPAGDEHLGEILREAGSVASILLTHHHPDHAPGAAALAALSGAPVMASHPVEGEVRLADGQRLQATNAELVCVATPGHTRDHMAFHAPAAGAIFTGDAVLGRGTSVVDPPEGDVTAYIESLKKMRSLNARVIYPGHGPAVWGATAKLEEYIEHRKLRERQVLEALANGAARPEDLVPAIYSDYPEDLYPAAARSVLAHLLKLERERSVRRVGPRSEGRFELAAESTCSRCGRPAPGGSSLCDRCRLAALQEEPPTSPSSAT